MEFTFQVVLSLLAILFAYDAVCGERERGTLRLTFASPVPRGVYILGKITGSLLALTVPLLIPLAAGAMLLPLMGVPLSGAEWVRLALVVAAGMLYIGAILGLSVLVLSLTRSSATAFVLLLSLWVVGVLIVPRASVLLSARSVEVPSTDHALSQRARLWRQLWREDQQKIQDFMQDQMSGVEGLEDPESVFYLPRRQAMIFGDALIGAGAGRVRVPPRSWAAAGDEAEVRYHARLRRSLRRLLEHPIEMLLVSHGEPVLTGAREALIAGLDAPAWGEE